MNVTFVFLMGLTSIVISQVHCSGYGKKLCNCGLTSGGVDVCGCENVVVRPPLLPPKLHLPHLHEVESKKLEYVQPVHIPKHSCHKLEKTHHFETPEVPYPYHYSSPKESYYPKYQEHYDAYETADVLSDYSAEEYPYHSDNKIPVAPADAVSLTLAYELAKRAGQAVKEEGLTFGPRSIPKEGAIVKARKEVPEDHLFNFNKQVVELKFPSVKRGMTLEEEAEEALLAAEEEEAYEAESEYGGSTNYLSYADLGYVPEKPKKDVKFIIGQPDFYEEEVVPYEKKSYPLPLYQPCDKPEVLNKHEAHEEYYSEEEEAHEYSNEETEEKRYSFISTGKSKAPCNDFLSKLVPVKSYGKY